MYDVDPCPKSDSETSEFGESTKEEAAFLELWHRHGKSLMHSCRVWMSFHQTDAEEAFARARMEIYLQFPRYGSRLRDPAAWMRRVTYNICMDLHRERDRRREQALEVLDTTTTPVHGLSTKTDKDPEQQSLGNELRTVLQQAIAALPERLRDVVVLRTQSLGHRQVAERLAITEATSRKRMQQARAILRRRLERYRKGEVELEASSALPLSLPPRRRRMPRVERLRRQKVRLPRGWVEDVFLLMTPPIDDRRREVLEHYVDTHPTGWKGRLLLARRLVEQGNACEALDHLESLTDRHGEHPELWLTLAAAQALRGDTAARRAVYQRAAVSVRRGAELLFEGLSEVSLGRPERAVAILAEAGRRAPKDTLPRIILASVHDERGRPAEAAAVLEETLALDPKDVGAWVLGHRALHLLGRHRESDRRVRRVLELDSDNPIALSRLLLSPGPASADPSGKCLELELRRKARTRMEEHAQRSAAAAAWLAGLYLSEGEPVQADRVLARLVAECPRLLPARLARARFLAFLHCTRRAWAVLEPAFEVESQWRRSVDLLACRLAPAVGRAAEVPARGRRLLDRHGLDWETAAVTATALTAAGFDPERALDLGQAAVAAQPDLPAAHVAHGRLLLVLKRYQAAVEVLNEAWGLLPEPHSGPLAGVVARSLSEAYAASGKTSTAALWVRRTGELGRSRVLSRHSLFPWEESWEFLPEDGPTVLV